MKYKEQIIGVVVLVAVFGVMGAAWQFHFKEIFDGYKQDDKLRETLESSYDQLTETFQGYKPELLINEWQNYVQPWRNAREERAGYFNLGDWFEVEFTPDEDRMLKFWYTEESEKMLRDLYTTVYEKMGGYDRFPQDMRAILNVQTAEDWGGKDIAPADIEMNLKYLNFGQSLTEFLLDSKMTSVSAISVWPRRVPAMYAELLQLQTVGIQGTITAKDLVNMLDKLRQEPRYFSVEAIKISYAYIAYNVEPQLNVSFLLTQARYRTPKDETETPQAARPLAGRDAASPRMVTTEEPGIFSKAWTWFKRNVLVMN
jgi:hypothetical protein